MKNITEIIDDVFVPGSLVKYVKGAEKQELLYSPEKKSDLAGLRVCASALEAYRVYAYLTIIDTIYKTLNL